MNDRLTDDNFLIFCAKVYDNPTMHSTEEFIEDLNRIKYVKKLFTRYVEYGELKERLLLNHFTTLHNCFGPHLARILYLKLDNQYHLVKPFLVLLNALPKVIHRVGQYSTVYTDDIPMDPTIIRALREIRNG